jgi:NodT family efflux transporter outer membrane factor (OMF) lipoprotein
MTVPYGQIKSEIPMRRAHRLLSTGLSILALCAAAAGTSTAEGAGAPAAAVLAGLPQTDWPAEGWWKAWNDAQLDTLMSEALANAPSVAEADARLRKALASTGGARARLLPTLDGNGVVKDIKQSYNEGFPPAFVPKGYNGFGHLSLDFDWEIDFWGKNRAAVAAATSDARAAAADAAEARLILETSIAATYADLARLYADRDVAERALVVRQETQALVAKRVDNGLDTQAELSQAKAGPPSARADLAAIDEDLAVTRNALAALVGADPDRGSSIRRPTATAPTAPGLPANIAANLIGRRPDITAARWRAEAASRRTAEAKAAFYPNINLAAYIGEEALHLDNMFASGSDIGGFGPAVNLPIFDGGQRKANLRGARADRDAAVAAYKGAIDQALREVADAVAGERALGERLQQSRAALAADEDAHRIARLRYDGGLATYQSVLLAEDAVLAQRRVVADLESRALSLDIALIRALGGGFAA